MVKDYYLILEVQADADLALIKSSYRRLAKKYHPDVNPSHDAQDRMKALTEAYSILGDAHKRAVYDRKRVRWSTEYTETYTKPPPRKSRKEAYADIKITESEVADAIRLSKVNLILTSTLLRRHFGLEYDHAAKLFNTLIRRGYVDEDGRWTAKARYGFSAGRASEARKGSGRKSSAHSPPADDSTPTAKWQEFRISEQLVSQAIRISRTNIMLSVSVLQKRLDLDHAKAERLYSLLGKRGFIDDRGVWTDEARTRAKVKDAPPRTAPKPAAHSHEGATARPAPKRTDPDLITSEELVTRATGLASRTRKLTIAFLQRRFDLDFLRAARLFEILIKRGFIDRSGNWTTEVSHKKHGTSGKRT